ncbi:MAG: ArnT family glycosyltransferase [Gemmatimonadales bacterium]
MTLLERPAGRLEGPAETPVSGKRTLRPLLGAALALGFLLRAPLYFANPSLLLDEGRLALNIASRSFAELALPLDYDQTAPLLFLWAAKALTLLFGVSEYALRAIPFVAGLAMLPLTYLVARRVLGAHAGVLAVALAAVSPLYLQYVRQVKPYTLDGVVALALLWLALDWVDDSRSARAWRRLLVAGTAAVWLSIPAVLVLAGMTAVLWLAPEAERPPRPRLMLAGITWIASFLLAYLWIYQPASDNPYMQQFWRGSLLTLWEPGVLGRAWQGLREFGWQIFGGGSTEPPLKLADRLDIDGVVIAVVLLAAVGLRHAAGRSGRTRALLLIAPLAGAIAASLAGGYPIAGRIMLFAAPGVVVAVAGGVVTLLARLAPRLRVPAAVVGTASLLGLALPLGVTLALHPLAFEHVRPAVAEYERRAGFREPVYVFSAALPAWTFYTTDWSSPDRDRLARMARLGAFGGAAFENAPPRSRPMLPPDSAGLSHVLRGTTEIIGAFAGAQWRSGVGNVQFHPDTNWAVHEARRIAAAGATAGGVWVLFIRTLGLERQVFAEMGMCADDVYQHRGVLLARFVPRLRAGSICHAEPHPGSGP